MVVSPGMFDQFAAAAGEPAQALWLPDPVAPGPARQIEEKPLSELRVFRRTQNCDAGLPRKYERCRY